MRDSLSFALIYSEIYSELPTNCVLDRAKYKSRISDLTQSFIDIGEQIADIGFIRICWGNHG